METEDGVAVMDTLKGSLATSYKTVLRFPLVSMQSSNCTLAIHPRSWQLCLWLFTAPSVMLAKTEEQPRPSSAGKGVNKLVPPDSRTLLSAKEMKVWGFSSVGKVFPCYA